MLVPTTRNPPGVRATACLGSKPSMILRVFTDKVSASKLQISLFGLPKQIRVSPYGPRNCFEALLGGDSETITRSDRFPAAKTPCRASPGESANVALLNSSPPAP